MRFEICHRLVVALAAFTMLGFALSGCHSSARSVAPAHPTAATQLGMYPSTATGSGPWSVPQTGQRRTLITADDGDLRAGKPWPVPRFEQNGDGTVTDRLTGLVWTRNANQNHGPADWAQAVSGASTCNNGGFSDWRLPNRRELESLLDSGRFDPALPAGHPFNSVQSSYYWTSTTTANSDDDAWVVHFYIGFTAHDDKAGTHYVWYVRSGRYNSGTER